KGIAQPLNDLELRQIGIAEPRADEVLVAGRIALEHALEIVEEFGRAVPEEIAGAALRFGPLILVIEAAGDRMMGIMCLDHEVGDGELKLVRPEASGFAGRRQAVARAE